MKMTMNKKPTKMDMEIQNAKSANYEQVVRSQDQALAHLFFHCCYKDEEFNEKEMDALTSKLVNMGLNKELNIKKEVKSYLTYKDSLQDELSYIIYLVALISPVHDYALFSSCAELSISDETYSLEDEELLKNIGNVLQIKEPDQKTMRHLAMQRRIVRLQRFFWTGWTNSVT